MEERRMGESSIVSSVIGFGTWEMSTTVYGHIDVQEASRAVQQAIDYGITLFDTAEVYGPYHSEELLGKALGNRRKEITLVTKVGYIYDDQDRIAGRLSEPSHVIAHAEDSLRRLNTDVIDLLLIHWPDHKTPISDVMGALEQLKQEGKIREYGVSNYDVPMLEECVTSGNIAANQVGYNLYDRRMEAAVLPFCREHNIGFMAYGTLGFGLLTGAFDEDSTFVDWDWRSKGGAFGLPLFEREHFLKEIRVTRRLQELAGDYGRSVAQLAIAWVVGNPTVSVALVGMRNEKELQENVAATEWRLTDEDREEIDRIFEEEGVPTYVDAQQAA